MIKNIVFDIGSVLVEFEPKKYLDKFNFTEEVKEEIFQNVFRSTYWCELDRGTITEEEAMEKICKEASHIKKEIAQVMENWMDMLVPKEDTIEILKEVKHRGYNIYILSNYHKNSFEKICRENGFFTLIDGAVVSYSVNYLKPEEEIYKILLDRYSLIPKETLFIDDMKDNVEAAEKLGINAIKFTNSKELKEKLTELNII